MDAPNHKDLPKASRPGAVAPDAPLGKDWLLHQLGGRPVILTLGCEMAIEGIKVLSPDVTEILKRRYLGDSETAVYLIRPDQVIAARWTHVDPEAISKAINAMWCTL
jgi:3-(3-hydroxy-phenyl)propionate hydroxylase